MYVDRVIQIEDPNSMRHFTVDDAHRYDRPTFFNCLSVDRGFVPVDVSTEQPVPKAGYLLSDVARQTRAVEDADVAVVKSAGPQRFYGRRGVLWSVEGRYYCFI